MFLTQEHFLVVAIMVSPLGISKPKGTEFDAPLVLDLIEGCYLVENNRLKVFHIDGKPVPFASIKKICKKQ